LPDPGRIKMLCRPAEIAAGSIERHSGGSLAVRNGTIVSTITGMSIAPALEQKLLDVTRAGESPDAWVKFAVRLAQNPSTIAIEELYLFLEKANLPITPDGTFLAYKVVGHSYFDKHSGTFDNHLGKICSMPREDVDTRRDYVCSTGLHFCSKSYIRSFIGGGDHIVIVEIDPADVVSIPSDYDNTKGRTWRYRVVGELHNINDDAESVTVASFSDAIAEFEKDVVAPSTVEDDPFIVAKVGKIFKSELLSLLASFKSKAAVARHYGVDPSTPAKWMAKLGID
jgi:hypothetical protein